MLEPSRVSQAVLLFQPEVVQFKASQPRQVEIRRESGFFGQFLTDLFEHLTESNMSLKCTRCTMHDHTHRDICTSRTSLVEDD